MKVLIIGYYGRKNLGDDIFEKVFIDYMTERQIVPIVKNIDEVLNIPDDISCIIFGGGDLINDYFNNKINKIVIPSIQKRKIPIYALSIGIPYPGLIDKGYLDKFDFISTRSIVDEKLLKNRYSHRYSYSPDFSILLKDFSPHKNYQILHQKSKKIGIFLTRTIFSCREPAAYEKLCNQLSELFQNLLNRKVRNCFSEYPQYELYLFPFCTEDKTNHDDRIINRDIYKSLQRSDNDQVEDSNYKSLQGCDDDQVEDSNYEHLSKFENLHLCNEEIEISRVRSLFSSFDFTICTRFHAHMLSLISNTPFLSISTTRKVDNLLKEIGPISENFSVKYDIHDQFSYPISLNVEDCINKFNYLVENSSTVKNRLLNVYQKNLQDMHDFTNTIDNLLFYKPGNPFNHLDCLTEMKTKIIAEFLSTKADGFYFIEQSDLIPELMYQKGSISKYFSSKNINSPSSELLADFICYTLCKDRRAPYHYGLTCQLLSSEYCLYESVKWILKDIYSKDYKILSLNNTVKFSNRKLNMNLINKNLFKGFHRSGWSYVLSNLEKYHNDNGIVFDSYLDKTFGWESEFLSFANVIPYKFPWIGFFHHTNCLEYSDHNLSACIENPYFLESLPYCKGIFVLSKNNKKFLENKLDVPVYNLIHPTEMIGYPKFDYCLFKEGPVKKIVQVGAWLRNTYSIYHLKSPENYMKIALKGKGMNNYFVENEKWEDMIQHVQNMTGNEIISGCVVKGQTINKYVKGLLDIISSERDSVYLLKDIDNDEYDKLLKTSIVFLDLIDASAVNTIIECIVRNTPVIVNRLPATEEYLGTEYPLFYEKIEDVQYLLKDLKKIKKAWKYLKNMNKSKFEIEYFINSFLSLI